MIESKQVSVIIPARNEGTSLEVLLPNIRNILPECELILVNDGSTDDTETIGKKYADVLVNHPVSLGNGASIKSGARSAGREVLVFMDGDGQHRPEDIPKLLSQLDGYNMVVGARDGSGQANIARSFANRLYNRLASYITGHKILDLTSGFRAVRRKEFCKFLYLLPNGFSYPTTITMSFLRAGYPVKYIPIKAEKRIGKSHINPVKDGIRFLIIIFKVGTLYSPLKLFAPLSAFFFLFGAGYYTMTFLADGRFTNMGALLFMTSVLIFLIGLISEQITTLIYKSNE